MNQQKKNSNDIKINDFNDLINYKNKFSKADNYFFRGHFDSKWILESSYKRDFRTKNGWNSKHKLPSIEFVFPVKEQLFYIQKKLIELKKELEEPEKSSIKIETKLEILAKLQHYGSPTLLIDFTSSFIIALWFAVSVNNYEFKEKGFFKIYYFQLENDKKIKTDIENLYTKNIYKSPDIIENSFLQDSYFIIDNSNTLKKDWNMKSISISHLLRDEIINFLNEQKIDASYLFPKLEGLYKNFQVYSKDFLIMNSNLLDAFKKYDVALKQCDKAMYLDFNNDLLYFNKANILQHQEQYNEANIIYDIALDKNKSLGTKIIIWLNKGNNYMKLKQYSDALKCYQKIIDKPFNSYTFSAYLNKGNILLRNKQYDDAIECYSKITQKCDKLIKFNDKRINLDNCYNIAFNCIDAYNNQGIAFHRNGQYDDVINCYENVFKIDKNNIDAYIRKANVSIKNEEIDVAIECYKKIIEINLNDMNEHLKKLKFKYYLKMIKMHLLKKYLYLKNKF